MALRITAFFVILISILFFPIWASFFIAIVAIIYFRFFWEATFLFFISDLMFNAKETRFLNLSILSTIIITLILLVAELIKRKLKFYQK